MKPKRPNLTTPIIGTLLRVPAFRLSLLALAGGFFWSLGSSPAEGCDRVAFSVADQLPLGGASLNVVVADFNGDSKADLAATNDQNVIVYLGDGAGGFGPANTFPAGALPRGLAVGDFDGDGKPDLAVANYSDISILINDGQGGFKAPVNYAADQSPIAIGVGDFNGDGKQDLAVVNSQNNDVSILLGDGAGHFGPPTNFPTGALPYALAVGDLNGDGNLDLVISNYGSQEINILAGDGQGNFITVNSYPLGGNATNVVIGDFNGDHHPDLAVGVFNIFPDNHIEVFLGDGNGNFTPTSGIPAFNPQGIVAADFDGDGNLDLATTLYTVPGILVALGDGAGGFGPPQHVTLPQHPLPFGLASGDFNNDGKPDLAIANYGNGHVSILLNLPSIQISALDPYASESDLNRGRFKVTRNGCVDEPLVVQYSVNGTARPGIDYRVLPGTVTIPAGGRFVAIPVVPLGDTLLQDGATVIVTLATEPYYAVGKEGAATVTIYQ
jgi:FG-GAP-like repeat/FG-GAP repeat